MSDETDPVAITNSDRNKNALKAFAKLFPGGTGDALVQLFTGVGDAARERRFFATLEEIRDILRDNNIVPESRDNEDYVELVAKAADPIGRATNEDKRLRFRDLLLNSLSIPQGDPAWEESMYCLDLLKQIDAAGLYALSKIVRADREGCDVALIKFSGHPQWLIMPKSAVETGQPSAESVGRFEEPRYHHVLIEKQINLLTQQLGLISSRDRMVRPRGNSDGLMSINFPTLTPAGQMLVKWTVADF